MHFNNDNDNNNDSPFNYVQMELNAVLLGNTSYYLLSETNGMDIHVQEPPPDQCNKE